MTQGFKWMLYPLIAFLLVVSVLSGGKTLYYFLFATGLIWIGKILILNHSERNLFIRYYTSDNTIHSGDSINIDYKISNTSLIPILHAVIDFKLDQKLNTESSLKEIAYFGNFDRLNFSKDIVCKYRGYYKVGQVRVELYDPLLLDKRIINFDKEIDITVYPKVIPVKQKILQSKDFYGTLKSNMRTMEDRTNLINIRPYVPGDQLKNIHWKLSAKSDDLQTKEFEQTVSTKLVILMDGSHTFAPDLDLEETMVSFGISLIKEILDDDIKLKVMLNDQHGTVIEGGTPADFQAFMEAFTSFECNSDIEFTYYVNHQLSEAANEQTGLQNTLVLITQSISEAFLDALNPHSQVLNIFSFAPQTIELKEMLMKRQSKTLRFHYIDQIMDVTYGK